MLSEGPSAGDLPVALPASPPSPILRSGRYSRRFDRISRERCCDRPGVGSRRRRCPVTPDRRRHRRRVGPARPGPSRARAPDEDTLTLAWDAATAAAAAAGVRARPTRSTRSSGAPAGRRSRKARASRSSPSALSLRASVEARSAPGSAHSGMEALAAGTDAIGAGLGTLSRSWSLPTRSAPGSGPASKPAAARGPRRSCSAPKVSAGAIGTPGHSLAAVRRPLPRRRRDRQPRSLRRAAVPRGDLPAECRACHRATSPHADGGRGRSPIPTAGSAPVAEEGAAPTRGPSSAVYAAVGDTGAAAALLGAIAELDTRRPGRGRRNRRRPHQRHARRRRRTGARRRRRREALAGGPARVRTPSCCERGANSFPAARPSRWACRPRVRCSCAAPTRCSVCSAGAASTAARSARLRRSTRTCINCGGPKLEPVALARGGSVHTYVVNHTMPAPFVAPLPIVVLDMDDGARLMLQVIGDGTDVGDWRPRSNSCCGKYAHERGVPVYGFKARPVGTRTPGVPS